MASLKGTAGLRILAYGSCGSSGPDSWPLCNGQVIPTLSGPVLVEWTHRLFTLVVGLFVLGMTIIAWTRYREEKRILQFSTVSFLVLLGQILLGMVTVKTDLDPLVSTAHLAVASALFAVVILNAITVRTFSVSSDLVLK